MIGTIVATTRRGVLKFLVQIRTEVSHGSPEFLDRFVIHTVLNMRHGPSVHVTDDKATCHTCSSFQYRHGYWDHKKVIVKRFMVCRYSV
jgi:hypothetical protein